MSLVSLVALVASVAGGCSGSTTSSGGSTSLGGSGKRIVVTYPVLGALVRDLVGDRADVTVLMPDGIDPHDYRPSAKDVAKLEAADAVVANGLGLEEGLEDAVARARDKGVPVFVAADHVALRAFGRDEIPSGPTTATAGDDHDHGEVGAAPATSDAGPGTTVAGEDEHGHEERVAGGDDPHIWVDPLAMRDATGALAVFLQERLGLDLAAASAAQRAGLEDLDARTRQTLEVIPPDRRLLVTGHESLGYFADRYGFRLVGALIPATTSQAAPSAGELAALEDQIRRYQVPAVFNEIGTPPALSEAVSRDTGARVVELATHTLPADGQYATFIQDLATGIRDGLQ